MLWFQYSSTGRPVCPSALLTALSAFTHEPRVSARLARLASQHGVQRVAGARLNRGDYIGVGRALAYWHSFDPLLVRPAGRLIEFHRDPFTTAPRWGKRHENGVVASDTTQPATARSSQGLLQLGDQRFAMRAVVSASETSCRSVSNLRYNWGTAPFMDEFHGARGHDRAR
jgi:hypothetical protein